MQWNVSGKRLNAFPPPPIPDGNKARFSADITLTHVALEAVESAVKRHTFWKGSNKTVFDFDIVVYIKKLST